MPRSKPAATKAAPAAAPAAKEVTGDDNIAKALGAALNALPKDLSKLDRDALLKVMMKSVGKKADKEVRAWRR